MFKEKDTLKETIDRVNKETRERHLNMLIKGFIRILGVISLILGIVIAVVIIHNYMYNHNWKINFAQKDISSLGDLLAGTVGVLFAVAGVSFLIITIYQNRDEMEQTRAIFRTQLAESTFFKLVELHKELVSGLEKKEGINFSQAMTNVTKAVIKYKKELEEGKFHHFDETKNSPVYQYHSYKQLSVVGKSLVHLLNHVQTNLRETAEFYHTTIYNNLSDEEKFLIGMIVQNYLVEGLKFYTYPYSEAYLNTSEMEIMPVLFPVLEINTRTGSSYPLSALHHNDENLLAELKRLSEFEIINIYGEKPVLECVWYKCTYTSGKTDYGYEDYKTPSEGIDLLTVFNKAIYLDKAHSCEIEPKYCFRYKERSYYVGGHKMVLSIEGIEPFDDLGYRPITDYKRFLIRLVTKKNRI